ncbi:MAG TPA: hypothetical protein VK688_03120 [Gemmatimonadales bacterium]|nr:hypothetical protein [Gemmatimonadales bacterium]
MGIFIEHPGLAALLGGLFLLAYWLTRRPAIAVAGLGWIAYSGYEAAMRLRWLCTGECNIRLDLLAIYPLLVLVSLIALVALVRWQLGRHT